MLAWTAVASSSSSSSSGNGSDSVCTLMMQCNIESFIMSIIIIMVRDDDCCTSTTNAGNALLPNVLFMDIYVYIDCGIWNLECRLSLSLSLLRQKKKQQIYVSSRYISRLLAYFLSNTQS